MPMKEIELTISGYLPDVSDEERKEIESLIRRFNNARRRAYQMQRKKVPKPRGLKTLQEDTGLNRRYASDAWHEVSKLFFFTTFGGKENKQLLDKGKIRKEEWHKRRNRILLSRGDSSKEGNLNLPVVKRDGGLSSG